MENTDKECVIESCTNKRAIHNRYCEECSNSRTKFNDYLSKAYWESNPGSVRAKESTLRKQREREQDELDRLLKRGKYKPKPRRRR